MSGGEGADVGLQLSVGPPEEACLEVLLSGQRVLRIRPGFDAATLQRLLAVLEPPAC